MAEEQKLISIPIGHTGGSDAWFWDDAAGPDDDLRPFWETMPFLPKPPAPATEKARRPTVRLVVEKKYNPDQPRVPAGDPRGGQWTSATTQLSGIPNLSEADITAAVPAIVEVQAHGIKTGDEMLIVIDVDGNTISKTEGTHDSVDVIKAGFYDIGKSPWVSVHNHPTSASFSSSDIPVFLAGPAAHMIVVGHDGTIYVASKTMRSTQINAFELDGARPSKDFLRVFNDFLDTKFEDYYTWKAKVDSGELSGDQAWYQHSHQINEQMAQKHRYTYTRISP